MGCVVLLSAATLGTGCSRTPGSKATATAPPNPVGTFRAPECRSVATGRVSKGPAATYYLSPRSGRYELTELADSGRGAQIRNYWRDAGGHNFVTYQKGGPAWQYVIPDDPTQPGQRRVYARGTYRVEKQVGTYRISGVPAVDCTLVHAGQVATGAPAPAPEPAAPPPPPPADPSPALVCSPGATQECIGAGACRGGQVCLPDGSAWGACDCGAPEAGAPESTAPP
jgi:hypothetical protein